MKQAQRVNIKTPEDIVRSVESVIADGEPRLLERDGKIVAEVVPAEDVRDDLKAYASPALAPPQDPGALRAIARKTGPVFADIDIEEFKRELREQRIQDSTGRPG